MVIEQHHENMLRLNSRPSTTLSGKRLPTRDGGSRRPDRPPGYLLTEAIRTRVGDESGVTC